MRTKHSFVAHLAHIIAGLGILALLLGSHSNATAQTGDNEVYNSSGTCCSTSAAFVDATAYCSSAGACTTSDDLCVAVNAALNALPTAGGVVDARGINSGGSNKCGTASSPTTPYTGTYTIAHPSTVLLPSGTIKIFTTWILPDRTKVIGEGNNPQGGTQILAGSGFSTGTAMIQMGSASSSLCNDGTSGQCYGVSVEDLMLNGENQNIDGIVNSHSGAGSYVDHVNLHEILGIGLTVTGSATQDSGPYANLAVSPADSCAAASSCVQLGDSTGAPSSTRGIHGMTCTCNTSLGAAGITLDSSNTTLEDIHFEGFVDGVLVGSKAASQSNVLLDINGGAGDDSMTNVIHVCGSHPATCSTAFGVTDLSIIGALAAVSSSTYHVTTLIQDDITNTTVPGVPSGSGGEATDAAYVLGQSLAGGYSRIATSPVADRKSVV